MKCKWRRKTCETNLILNFWLCFKNRKPPHETDHDVINSIVVWILNKQVKKSLLRISPTRFCHFLCSYFRAITLGVTASGTWSFSTSLKKYRILVLKVELAEVPIFGVPDFEAPVSCIGYQYWRSLEWLIFKYLYKRKKAFLLKATVEKYKKD